MKQRKQAGDASFLIGLVLGIALGAAITIVLLPQSAENNRQNLADAAQKSQQALEDTKKQIHSEVEQLRNPE
jgi:gas vesicle protein